MANDKPLASGSYTIVDVTDQISLYSNINCNVSTNQYLSSKDEYSPNYGVTNALLEAEIFKMNESDNLINQKKVISSKWMYKLGNGTWTNISNTTVGFELIGTSPKFTGVKLILNLMNRENPSLVVRNIIEFQEIWMDVPIIQTTDIDFKLLVQGNPGLDSYAVTLTNENQSITCLPDGTILDGELGATGRAKTKVEVFKGNQKLTPVLSNPGENQFSCSLNSLFGATTFNKESDNCTFYLDGVNNDFGNAIIDVFLESNTLKTQKTFTFNKSKDGENGTDAYSIDIVGKNQFMYDTDDNVTPSSITLSVIGQNFTPTASNIQWYYKNGSSWTVISKGLTLNVTPSMAGWNDKELYLKAVYLGNTNIYDEFTVYKIKDGKYSVSFSIETPNGNSIRNEDKEYLTLEAKLYYGEINKSNTSTVSYIWYKQSSDGTWEALTTSTTGANGGNILKVYADDIPVSANFKCIATFKNKTYEATQTLNDFTDPYIINILNIGGVAFKNSIGSTYLYCEIQRVLDILDDIEILDTVPATTNYKEGQIIYVKSDDKYRKKVGTSWSILTSSPSESNGNSDFTYTWRKTDKNGNTNPTPVANGKICKVLASSIDESATFMVELKKNNELLAFSQVTVTNTKDGIDGADGIDGKPGADGEDAYSVQLSNEAHVILCDYDGTPKTNEIGTTTSKAKSSIIAKKGNTSLTSIGTTETLTKGKFKYEIISNDTCIAERIDNDSFYLKNIYADSGYVDIKVYVESSTTFYIKRFTWSKSIEAENAKYITLSGENTFTYENKSDTTSTPTTIKITAEVFNIKNYSLKWQYKNANDDVAAFKDITSSTGSLISGNTLNIDDKTLFINDSKNIVIKCIATDLSNNDTFYATHNVFKVYNGNDGTDGVDGLPAKTVKITGIDKIKYTDGVPNYTEITLTATPTNYTSPKFSWSELNGATFEDITTGISTDGSKLTLSESALSDTNLFRVKCTEANGKNASYDEFQVVKVYDGTDANEYFLKIVGGTRSLVYNGKNNLITTQITPFEIEVWKNGENITNTSKINNILWECTGYFTQPTVTGQVTYTPIPLATYDMEDMSKLNTTVMVTVNVEGRILKDYVSIAVSKNSTALDWIEDWEGSKVLIGDNYFISPRIFAGTKNLQTNKITGLALGRDIISNSDLIGMAIYNENNVIGEILAKPDADNNIMIFGNTPGEQFRLKANGKVEIEGGVELHNSTVSETLYTMNSKAKTFTSQPTVPYNAGDLWLEGPNGNIYKCNTTKNSGVFSQSDWELASKYTDDTKAAEALGVAGEVKKVTENHSTDIKTLKDQIILKTEKKDITEAIESATLSRADYIARNFLSTPLIVSDPSLSIYAESGIPNPPVGAVFSSFSQENNIIKNNKTSSNGNAWAIIIGYELYKNTTDNDKKTIAKDKIKQIADFMANNVSVGRFNSMDFKFIDTSYKYNSSSGAWKRSNYKELYITTMWLQVKAMMYAYEILQDETYLNLGLDILDSLFNTHFYINNQVNSKEIPTFLKWASYEYLACDNISTSYRFVASAKQYANQMGYYIHQAIKDVIRIVGDDERYTPKGDKYKPSDVLTGLKQYLKNAYETQNITAMPLGLPYGYFHRITNDDGSYSYIPQNWDFIENTWGDTWFVGDVVTYTIYSFAASGLTDIARLYANNYYKLRVPTTDDKWKTRFSESELLFYDRVDFNSGSHLDDDSSISITYTALFYEILKEIGLNEHVDACCYTLAKHQVNNLNNKNIDGGYPWNVSTDLNALEFKSLGEIINSQFYKNLNITSISSIDKRFAEIKITADSISSNISKNYYAKKDIDDKKFQTESEVKQTVDNLKVKFEESGGYNLFKNSIFANCEFDKWWTWGTINRWGILSYYKEKGDMYVYNASTTEAGGLWQNIDTPIKPNTMYTLSVLVSKEYNVKGGSFRIEYTEVAGGSHFLSQSIDLIFDNQRHSYTFTTPNDSRINYAKCGFQHDGTVDASGAYLIRINKPCLCEGEIAVWSPHPNEVRDGIIELDKDGIIVSNSDSDTKTIMNAASFSVEDNKGGTVAEFSAESYIPYLIADKVEAKSSINAPNIIKIQNKATYYVDLSSGSDSNDGLSWSSSFKTVQNAIDLLEKHIIENVFINIRGTGTQTIEIHGFSGDGDIRFYLENGTKLHCNQFNIIACSCDIQIVGNNAWSNSVGQIIQNDNGSCIYVKNSSYVYIYHLCICGSGKGNGQAVKAISGSNVDLIGCEVDRFQHVIYATNTANISIVNTSGSDISYIAGGKDGGVCYIQDYGTMPNADTNIQTNGALYVFGGTKIKKTDGTIYPPTSTAPSVPATTVNTRTWSFNNIYSVETLNGWGSKSELIQGYASTWNTGRWTGYIKFTDNMASIRTAISGATNLSGRIYIQRRSTSGNGTDSILCLYASDGTVITTSTYIDRGEGVWVSLSSAVVTKIQNGTIQYFYLKADANNKATYFKCESNSKIEITYTK